MNLRSTRTYALVILAGIAFTGCTVIKDVTYTVTPSPLEAHGDSVRVNVTGNIPEKSINKSVIADITPTIRWEGGEKQLKMVTIQGEKAAANGIVINSKTGGNFSYSDVVPYEEGMFQSELFVQAMAGKGVKRKDMGELKIADGVKATPYLVQDDELPIFAQDKFQRIINEKSVATINYLVNSSQVRGSELRDDDIKSWKEFLVKLKEDERLEGKGLSVDAYASPEGEVDKNDRLANNRAQSATGTMKSMAKRAKLEELDSSYEEKGLGEDWSGFRKLMEESDIEDKNLIIRILETYTDVNEREKEIKNLSRTYTEISKNILPKLRRSEMTLSYDVIGFSDEELTDISMNNPDSLNLEELLYAANLHSDMNDQLAVYKNAEARFTDDNRAANNIGVIYLKQGKDTDAAAQFTKADNIMSDAITSNNLGIIARRDGDRKKAAELFRNGMSAGDEAAYNLGIVNIQDGSYDRAVSNMKGYDSFNSAMATMLNGDPGAAMTILQRSPDNDTAIGHYLMAIISARQGDSGAVSSHLATAVAKDPMLRDRAMKDAEFLGMTLGL
jgi:tetratricopeptide (TPR) repeat protein